MPAQDLLEYRIYRSTSGSPGSYTLIGTSQTVDFTDSTVQPGGTYYYKVIEVSRYLSSVVTFDYNQSVDSNIFVITVPTSIQTITFSGTLPTNKQIYGYDAIEYTCSVDNVLIENLYPQAMYQHNYTSAAPVASYISTIPDIEDFVFSIVAGSLPPGLELSTYSSTQAKISGIPILPSLEEPVTEISYPINTFTIDRYYFVLKAESTINNQYGEYLYYIDVARDWCDVRDQFIKQVRNQTFSINRSPASNLDFLNYQKNSGRYTCP